MDDLEEYWAVVRPARVSRSPSNVETPIRPGFLWFAVLDIHLNEIESLGYRRQPVAIPLGSQMNFEASFPVPAPGLIGAVGLFDREQQGALLLKKPVDTRSVFPGDTVHLRVTFHEELDPYNPTVGFREILRLRGLL